MTDIIMGFLFIALIFYYITVFGKLILNDTELYDSKLHFFVSLFIPFSMWIWLVVEKVKEL